MVRIFVRFKIMLYKYDILAFRRIFGDRSDVILLQGDYSNVRLTSRNKIYLQLSAIC
jgi:hypothetical protein